MEAAPPQINPIPPWNGAWLPVFCTADNPALRVSEPPNGERQRHPVAAIEIVLLIERCFRECQTSARLSEAIGCGRDLLGMKFAAFHRIAVNLATIAICSRRRLSGKGKTMAKDILVGFGIDVDAVAGWLGSYGGEDSPDDISRGLFAGEVGSPRLLKMFERLGIKTTWFIPGHSIETFPKQMQAVADAGHEIGIHGYSHENPIAMTREQEIVILDKCIDLVTQLSGKRPTGYVAPWWEFSTVTNELLLERGIKYDHSLMHNDFHPYYVRVGDSWTKIDYSKQPSAWMTPLKRGVETDLIEIPANWYLDDLPPMMFIKKSPNSHGFVNPRHLEEMWRDQFDWVYRENDYAVFPITIHPDVSGRPQVLMMLERLYEHIASHSGVRFVTMNEMADDFARRSPRKK
jgi:peptidoglycan-N-acetylglucosamine deacetylase